MEAIEWLELQAMRAGLKPKDEKAVDAFFVATKKRAEAASGVESMELWAGLASDFDGWRDVKEAQAHVQALRGMPTVRAESEKMRQDEMYESMVTSELNGLMDDMNGPDDKVPIRERIQSQLNTLLQRATMKEDSSERRLARRVIRGILLGAREVHDPPLEEYFDKLRKALA
jgi:hypothetical protein